MEPTHGFEQTLQLGPATVPRQCDHLETMSPFFGRGQSNKPDARSQPAENPFHGLRKMALEATPELTRFEQIRAETEQFGRRQHSMANVFFAAQDP